MRPHRTWAIAAVAIATLALTPLTSFAQTRGGQRDSGDRAPADVIGEARAAVTQGGNACAVNTARWIGRGQIPKLGGVTGTEEASIFEVSCAAGPGFLVIKRPATVTFENCLAAGLAADQARAAAQPVGETCTLPENLDVKRVLQPLFQAASITCNIDEAALIGRTESADRYEVGCAGVEGAWIETPVNSTTVNRTIPCLEVKAANLACRFTTDAELTATVAALLTRGDKTCTVTGARYVGGDASRKFYEVGCEGQPGYMIRTDNTGAYQATLTCAESTGIAGGCTLTAATAVVAATQDAFAQRLQQANFPCAYQSHRVVGTVDQRTRTIVEYACSDRPNGLVAYLPEPGATRPAEMIDCIQADGRGSALACTLTPRANLLASLTRAMTADGKPCEVTNFRALGVGQDNGDVVELKCASGSGFIAEIPQDRARAGRVLTCAVSVQRGGDACEL